MLENFTIETFSEHLGSTFRIHPDSSPPLDFGCVLPTAHPRPRKDLISRAPIQPPWATMPCSYSPCRIRVLENTPSASFGE
jgi:hypothetical protein